MGDAPAARPISRKLQRENTVDPDNVAIMAKRNSERVVPPTALQTGTALEKLAAEHFEAFSELFAGRRSGFPSREVTIGSAMTGSAGETLFAHFCQKVVSDRVAGFRLTPVFSCETRPEKREWANRVHRAISPSSASGQALPCVFDDANDLGGRNAQCATHGRKCKVPRCNMFVCRFACKDFSSPQQSNSFSRVLAYVEWARPAFILIENAAFCGHGHTVVNGKKRDPSSRLWHRHRSV